MSNAEARAWWDDVQHLRPDAAPAARSRHDGPALRSVDDLPSAAELDAWLAEEAATAPRRFGRDAADVDAAGSAFAEEQAELDAAPRARRPERAAPKATWTAESTAVTAEVALTRRPAAAPAERSAIGSEGLLAARAAEAAAVAGPALRRAAREVSERRPRSPLDRTMSAPDRIAMWAVILGVLLVVIAATTSSAQAAGF